MNNGVLFGVVVVRCGGCAKRRGSRSEAKSETCSSTWSTAMGNLGGKGGEREGTEGVGMNAQRCLWTKIGHCNTVLSIFEIY